MQQQQPSWGWCVVVLGVLTTLALPTQAQNATLTLFQDSRFVLSLCVCVCVCVCVCACLGMGRSWGLTHAHTHTCIHIHAHAFTLFLTTALALVVAFAEWKRSTLLPGTCRSQSWMVAAMPCPTPTHSQTQRPPCITASRLTVCIRNELGRVFVSS